MKKKMQLDSETLGTLTHSALNWDSLGVFGLRGKEVGNAFYHAGFGGPPPNPKGQLIQERSKAYKKPRVQRGIVITSRELKSRKISTGVYFAEDTFEKSVSADTPDKEYQKLSPEHWDGKKVNMHGTRTMIKRRETKKRHMK